MAASLRALSSLQRLDLSANRLGSQQLLNLIWNRLGAAGARALSKVFTALTSLQILDLRFNQLDDNTIASLRTQLTHVKTLSL